jgi:hypothetical protein
MEAMQENTLDVVKRMREITLVMKTQEDVLQSQGVTLENIEGTVWSVICRLISIVLTMKRSRVTFFFQICWMGYKSMWNPSTWQMVRTVVDIDALSVL